MSQTQFLRTTYNIRLQPPPPNITSISTSIQPPIHPLLSSLKASHPLDVFMCVNVCDFQIWPIWATHWALSDYVQRWSPCQRIRRSTQPNVNVPLILLTHSNCEEKLRERESPGQVRHCAPPPRCDLFEETSAQCKVKLLGSLWH